jgi:hypothetical protein
VKGIRVIPIFAALGLIFLTTSMQSAQAGVGCGGLLPGSTIVDDSSGDPFACLRITNDVGGSPPFLRTDDVVVDICALGRPFSLVDDGPSGEAPFIIDSSNATKFPLGLSFPMHIDPFTCVGFLPGSFMGFGPPMEPGIHTFEGDALLEGLNGRIETYETITGFFSTEFLVLPESPMGVIAITVASLAVLGVFYAIRRNNGRLPGT